MKELLNLILDIFWYFYTRIVVFIVTVILLLASIFGASIKVNINWQSGIDLINTFIK